jgi:hypothetical protein
MAIGSSPPGTRVLDRKLFVLTVAGALLAWPMPSSARGEDPVFSGPQPGETLAGFKLMGVYDETAGKEFDPIADAAGQPTLLIFVHKLTRPGIGLTRGLVSYAKSIQDAPHSVAIAWLDDDKAKAEQRLKQIRGAVKLEAPVGISVDGGEGPGSYGLNRNVELTILVADKNKVISNFALVQPSISDGVKIAGAFAKLLGKEPPTAEALTKIAYPNMQMNNRNRRDRASGRDAKPAQ